MVIPARLLSHSRWRNARWLVLAPHPDDETLGAGALIAETARDGRLAAIAYLTDGTGSHPAGTAGLASVRRREARLAIQRLAGTGQRIVSVGWQDARPAEPSSAPFERSRLALGALIRAERIDAIAVTAENETHCDHVAAYLLARAVAASARRAVALFAYRVWSDADRRPALRTNAMPAGRRRHALAAHRSQLSPSMGPGFRLSASEGQMPGFDRLELRDVHR